MDSLIAAAGRALAAGDPLAALKRVALREDPPALALRGIAMAQLGDIDRAKALLRQAVRGFGAREAVARARCVVAEAELAIVSRDLGWPPARLATARATLEAHGDRINAAHARYIEARRLLLVGRLDEAERLLAADAAGLPPVSQAARQLVLGGILIRRLRIGEARNALTEALGAAREAGVAALAAEIESASRLLDTPAARLIAPGEERFLLLDDVEALLASDRLVVDGCRHAIRRGATVVALATRPVLFALARTLAEAWPGDSPRAALLARAFGARFTDESHRARLRVEIGRLRAELGQLAEIRATERGFTLASRTGAEVVVLAPPIEERHADVLALLADGEAWSSSALALVLGKSQRTVQRALDTLAAAGKAQSFGQGPAQRWTTPPVPGFPTSLLLPAAPLLG